MNETNSKVFFELLKIGLWGKSSAIVHVESPICWDEIRENALEIIFCLDTLNCP